MPKVARWWRSPGSWGRRGSLITCCSDLMPRKDSSGLRGDWSRNVCRSDGKEESLPHHVFDLRPDVRIALALHVPGSEGAVEPGGLAALDRSFFVIRAEIAEDFCPLRIGGHNLTASVDDAIDRESTRLN